MFADGFDVYKTVQEFYNQFVRDYLAIPENRAAYNKRQLAKYHKNPEPNKARMRQWQKDNPEQFRATQAKRRAMKRGADGEYTKEDIAAIYRKQQGRCVYCEVDLNGIYHVDHVYPLSRGGSNWPENLACACEFCNLSKGNKLLSEWKPDKYTLDRL